MMREPQEYEGFWFSLAAPFSVSEGKPPELDQPRLVRMQFQTKLYQPVLKITQQSFGISPVLKAQHNVVRISDNYDITRCQLLAPSFHPQIKYVMQVHIRKQRRNDWLCCKI